MTQRCYNCGSDHIINVEPERDPNVRKNGKPPYGFELREGRLEFNNSSTGHTVVTILRWHAQGNSYREIAQHLTEEYPFIKSPSGGEWSHTSVWRVAHQARRLIHLIPLRYALQD